MSRLGGLLKFLRGQMALCFRWVILRRCTVRLIMATIVGEKVSTGCDMIITISAGRKTDEMLLGALTYRTHFPIMDLAQA